MSFWGASQVANWNCGAAAAGGVVLGSPAALPLPLLFSPPPPPQAEIATAANAAEIQFVKLRLLSFKWCIFVSVFRRWESDRRYLDSRLQMLPHGVAKTSGKRTTDS